MTESRTSHCGVCNEGHTNEELSGCYVRDMRRVFALERRLEALEAAKAQTPVEVAIWGRNEVDRIHSDEAKPVSVCRACDLSLYGATCTCGKAKPSILAVPGMGRWCQPHERLNCPECYPSPTPADMLSEAVVLLERAQALVQTAGVEVFGVSAAKFKEFVSRVRAAKREADSGEGHACAMCGGRFPTASSRDAHLATACPETCEQCANPALKGIHTCGKKRQGR